MIDHNVCSVTEHIRLDTDRRDQPGMAGADAHMLHRRDRLSQRASQVAVRGGELVYELVVASLEVGVALSDQHPFVRVADAFDVYAQPEPVEQLRAQLAFLGIHGADEDEARWVRERHPL